MIRAEKDIREVTAAAFLRLSVYRLTVNRWVQEKTIVRNVRYDRHAAVAEEVPRDIHVLYSCVLTPREALLLTYCALQQYDKRHGPISTTYIDNGSVHSSLVYNAWLLYEPADVDHSQTICDSHKFFSFDFYWLAFYWPLYDALPDRT